MNIFLKASSLNLSKMYNHSSQCSVFFLAVENTTAVLHSCSPLEEMETELIPFCSRLVTCLQYLYMAIFFCHIGFLFNHLFLTIFKRFCTF